MNNLKLLIATLFLALAATACTAEPHEVAVQPPRECVVVIPPADDPDADDVLNWLHESTYSLEFEDETWIAQDSRDSEPYVLAYAENEDSAAFESRGCLYF